MAFDLSGYKIYEGVVNATKGNTIWVDEPLGQKEMPVTLANETIVDHIRPGHELRVLTNQNGVVARIFNKTSGLTYEITDGYNAAMSKASSLKMAFLCGIPLFNLFIAPFLALNMLGYSYGAKGVLRSRRIAMLVKLSVIYALALLGGAAIATVFAIFWVIPLIAPPIIAYRGFMELNELDRELAEALTGLAKTGNPVAYVPGQN